jgi:hypothetical protein
LTYYHYATSESREEVLRVEINRVRAAADELRERYRAEYNHDPAYNSVDAPALAPVNDVMHDLAFDEAHTTIINGRHRHRRDLG